MSLVVRFQSLCSTFCTLLTAQKSRSEHCSILSGDQQGKEQSRALLR